MIGASKEARLVEGDAGRGISRGGDAVLWRGTVLCLGGGEGGGRLKSGVGKVGFGGREKFRGSGLRMGGFRYR